MTARAGRVARRLSLAFVVAGLALSAGCGEKEQVVAKGERKPDAKGYTGASPNYNAPGWKAGDEASWQQQLKQRAQAQNEHVRVGAKKTGS